MAAHFLHALQATFQRCVARPALTHQGRTYSYGDLDAIARRGAALLQRMGVASGDRVALCTSNKLAFLAAHLATLHAAAITLPLNPRFTREELRYFLADSGACVAVVGPQTRPIVESLQPELPELRVVLCDEAILNAPPGNLREPGSGARGTARSGRGRGLRR